MRVHLRLAVGDRRHVVHTSVTQVTRPTDDGGGLALAQACWDLEALEPRRSGSCRWAELEADLAQCEAYLKLRHPSPIP